MRKSTIILLFTLLPFLCLTQQIVGPLSVGINKCADYEITDGAGGPYIWSTSNGLMNTNQGTTVNICFKSIGTSSIQTIDFSGPTGTQIFDLNIEVLSEPIAEVYFPDLPICASSDTIEMIDQELPPLFCQTACEESLANYFLSYENQNNDYKWEIRGGTFESIPNSNAISVNWGPAGIGNITLTETNAAGCTITTDYCIEILEKSDAVITGAPTGSICQEQSIYLSTQSTNAVEFQWIVDGVLTGNNSNLEVSFASEGNHLVELVSKTTCTCSDTTSVVVNVTSNPGPEILCVGTVCMGQETTYYAGDVCNAYDWSVSNGSIVEGGATTDNYITVLWGSANEASITLSATGCNEAICNQATTVNIPIISFPNIEGPDVVCKEGQTIYSVPAWPGTSYNWSLSGNGFIYNGRGTNEITILWDDLPWADNEALLELSYENCLAGCGATLQKNIDLKPRFVISGDPFACLDNNAFIQGIADWNDVEGDWEVSDANGTIVYTESNASSLRFPEAVGLSNLDPGLYQIKLTNNSSDYCNTEATGVLELKANPDTPTGLIGDVSVCQGGIRTYSINNINDTDIQLEWIFRDNSGNTNTTYFGNQVSHMWSGNAPYSIDVFAVNLITGCQSETLITDILINDNEPYIDFSSDIKCVNQTDTYTIFNAEPNIEFVFIPSNAGVANQISDSEVEITWLDSGAITIEMNGECWTSTGNVDVIDLPELNVNYDKNICEGGTSFLEVLQNSPGDIITITDSSGNIINNNSDEPAGKYYITIENAAGCISDRYINIRETPNPDVYISTPDEKGFCQPETATLHALETNEGYTYQWYQDGIPVGTNSSIYTATDFGIFHVEITDHNGCPFISNEIELFDYCGPEHGNSRCTGGGGCFSNSEIRFDYNTFTSCNQFSFVNQSGPEYLPGSIWYYFENPSTGREDSTQLENFDYTFLKAGYYEIIQTGFVPDINNPNIYCFDYHVEYITVPVSASFYAFDGCPNESIEFINTSTYLPSESVASYAWDFGDPSSGISNNSNLENPEHVFSGSGAYSITLTITAASGCTSEYVQRITISPELFPDFNSPSIVCVNQAAFFEAQLLLDAYKYEWSFGDPNASASANYSNGTTAYHYYNTMGDYDVTLTVTDQNGCEHSITKNISTIKEDLTGDIVMMPDQQICEGDFATLTAPANALAYFWSTGETTESIEVGVAGEYAVTITGEQGCTYEPESVFLNVTNAPNILIIGRTYPEGTGYDGLRHVNRMEVCIDEVFDISTSWISNATFLWSTGSTNRWLSQNDLVSTLGVGEHEVTIEVTVPSTSCTFTSDPFILTINALPNRPQINSDSADPCEGHPQTLSIANPDQQLSYYWNTGARGNAIVVSAPGAYYATAVNEFGCDIVSNYYFIQAKPNTDLAPKGCVKTCFPAQICMSSENNIQAYQWLVNGDPLGPPSSTADLDANLAGDYQVVMTTWAGCIDTSDILTLEPDVLDHTINGIAFNDLDDDDIFNNADTPIQGAQVTISSGLTIIATITTDVNGEFTFNNIEFPNIIVQIDVSSTSNTLPAGEEIITLNFNDCQDTEECQFAFTDACSPTFEVEELFACPGETLAYEGQQIPTGESFVFQYLNTLGCDSLVEIMVSAAPPTLLNFNIIESCPDQDNGQLLVTTADNFSFSLDDSIESSNLIFENLMPGFHTLVATDDWGCQTILDFTIDELVAEPIFLTPNSTCFGDDNGTVDINYASNVLHQFSIDSDPNIGHTFQFNNLSAGMHTLWHHLTDDCIIPYEFEILISNPPSVVITPSNSCDNLATGSLEIDEAGFSNLTYSIDNSSNFVSQINFDQISVGTHTLWIQDEFGCISNLAFVIDPNTMPTLDLITNSSCPGQDNGTLQVIPDIPGNYTLSVDNGNSQNNQFDFDQLTPGNHELFLIDDLGCAYTYNFIIDETVTPDITYDITNSCQNMASGSIDINLPSNNFMIAFDGGTNFIPDTNYEDLSAGAHYFVVQDNNGCEYRFDFDIDAFANVSVVLQAGESCPNAQDGIITGMSPQSNIQLSTDGINFSSTEITGLGAGFYDVFVLDENNCTEEYQVEITEAEIIDISFEDYELDCQTSEILIEPTINAATGNLDFNWSDGSINSNLLVNTSGIYEVEVSDQCFSITHSWDLEFIESVPDENIYVPNIFSPALDAPNNIFKPFARRDIEIIDYEFDVFDRWGNSVCTTIDLDEGWDGTHLGKDGESGVYVWMYRLETEICGDRIVLQQHGDVTVIR